MPSPTVVFADAFADADADVLTGVGVDVMGADDRAVGVSGRGELTAPPVALVVAGRRRPVVAWAGPWPVDQRWWTPERSRRLARLQLVTEDGAGYLVALEQQHWTLLATYE